VLDFFAGSGAVQMGCKMLRRNYLAFEIDPDTAETARQRVAITQPPLPIEMPEQMGMSFD
jgi:DNA modification methylase